MTKQKRHLQTLSQIFRVLGDPTRLRIWNTLQDGEHNVTQLCRKLKVPQPTVSHHLGILRMSGLVVNRRDGKEIHYSLSDLTRGTSARALRSLMDGATSIQVGPIVITLTRK